MSYNQPYHCIGRGKNGWHASAPNLSSSGGTLDGYLKEAKEGALVFDADGVDYATYCDFVFKGPMLSCDLDPNTIDKFNKEDVEVAKRMLPGLSDGFKTMAMLAISGLRSLDRVGIGVFEQLLRGIPGMKIGHVHNNQVVWE